MKEQRGGEKRERGVERERERKDRGAEREMKNSLIDGGHKVLVFFLFLLNSIMNSLIGDREFNLIRKIR